MKMKYGLLKVWFLSLLVVFQILDSLAQTCDQITYTTINDTRRSIKYSAPDYKLHICDRGFIVDNDWYRFKTLGDDKMPTMPPDVGMCGTAYPIWLNGDHPETDNVVESKTACAVTPFLPGNCFISYDIKVIKCGEFYLYQLKEPKQCDFAYCAGEFSIYY